MKVKHKKILDLVVVWSGLSSLNFIDTYLKKKKKIDVISPNFKDKLKFKKKYQTEPLPSQMKGKNIFIPLGAKQRIENPGNKPVKIIEAQVGSILKETDIVRYQDIYGRVNWLLILQVCYPKV